MSRDDRPPEEPPEKPVLRLGHSPDPDDAFMWWPLFELDGAASALDTGRFRFEQAADDIESLNRRSLQAELDITAISVAHYPRVKEKYILTACGASMGSGYGPKLVAPTAMPIDALRSPAVTIAIPGERTTAFLVLNLLLGPGSFNHAVVPFDEIPARVGRGEFAAGLVIHEGQLTYEQEGLSLIVDLGAWWTGETGLPLPLGANVIRRDLDARFGRGGLEEVAGLLERSVQLSLQRREESIRYALGFARGMAAELADEFVSLYVNKWTLDAGLVGEQAVRTLLDRASAAGLTPDAGPIEFIRGGMVIGDRGDW